MGCIEASAYTTGTILGTFQSLDDCIEQCGICCVPTCPSDLSTFAVTVGCGSGPSAVEQTLIPNELAYVYDPSIYQFGCLAGGYDGLFDFFNPNLVTVTNDLISIIHDVGTWYWNAQYPPGYRPDMRTMVLSLSNPSWLNGWNLQYTKAYRLRKNEPVGGGGVPANNWNTGYPNGTYFVETRSLSTSLSVNVNLNPCSDNNPFVGMGLLANCELEPAPPCGETFPRIEIFGGSKTIQKRKYFQCEDGVLIDKTSEAFNQNPWSTTNSLCEQNFPIGTAESVVSTNSSASVFWNGVNFITDTTDLSLVDSLPGFDQLDSVVSDQFLFPSLTDLGALGEVTSLGFECNDTVGRSGCLQGGVITPSGVPLGTWFTGLDCEIANSGYGGCSGLMNM